MIKAKEYEDLTTLLDIAINRGYIYSQEYDPCSGRVVDKEGHAYLKQGYVEGFLAGFAYRMGGGNEGD
jgi:hypothetical protein